MKTNKEYVEEFRGWKRLLNEYHLKDERPDREGNLAELWLLTTIKEVRREERIKVLTEVRQDKWKTYELIDKELQALTTLDKTTAQEKEVDYSLKVSNAIRQH